MRLWTLTSSIHNDFLYRSILTTFLAMPVGVRGNVGQCGADLLRSEREFLKKNFISKICDYDGAKKESRSPGWLSCVTQKHSRIWGLLTCAEQNVGRKYDYKFPLFHPRRVWIWIHMHGVQPFRLTQNKAIKRLQSTPKLALLQGPSIRFFCKRYAWW